jgi:hypothetical protein
MIQGVGFLDVGTRFISGLLLLELMGLAHWKFLEFL